LEGWGYGRVFALKQTLEGNSRLHRTLFFDFDFHFNVISDLHRLVWSAHTDQNGATGLPCWGGGWGGGGKVSRKQVTSEMEGLSPNKFILSIRLGAEIKN